MSQLELPFRQIHLDFHTSDRIEGIAVKFDPERFAAALAEARVNSITCFARCHHGYIYYDTERFPERRHPHLSRNLLKEQIEACHARNIRVPIYTTVQWDHFTANHHPEWLVITADGRQDGTPPYEAGFYRNLCVNTPYTDFLKEHTEELLKTLPVDGLFFDIVSPRDCSCFYCRCGMEAVGIDASDPAQRRAFGLEMLNQFKDEMTRFVHGIAPQCAVFYNAGHIGPRHRAIAHAYTHFELESLPSGGWGYMHFPSTVRYARTLGLDCLSHTGKFHTTWGDFHSFKNQAALQFECFHMLALNAKCLIGDQLHPNGELCPHTYQLVGSVYREVEKKEPWCIGAMPITDIGVLTPEEFNAERGTDLPPSIIGAVRMLQEGAHQFDILDSQSDFSKYAVLILPDEIPVSSELKHKLETVLHNGGSLLASYRSGLNLKGDGFALDAFGIEFAGPAPYDCDFIRPRQAFAKGLPETEHVMYMQGMEVIAKPGSEILTDTIIPYFNRNYQHFCSHRHTPSKGEIGYPGIVRNGRCIYFAHPIFRLYDRRAPRWVKRLFLNALELLLPHPRVRLEAPSTTIAALNWQDRETRYVLHLLHYVPERRGREFDTIEDIIPIYNVKASVFMPETCESVTVVPDGQSLPFERNGMRVEFTIPVINGHQMVELRAE